VIDARTGATDRPFRTSSARDAAWSRDGRQLAIIRGVEPTNTDAFPSTTLHIWNADQKTLSEVPVKDAMVALNSSVSWTPDGTSLVVSLRNQELDREARARFKTITQGPVIVHKSERPVSRVGPDAAKRAQPVASHHRPKTGAIRSVLPQGKLTSYQPSRDGSFLTVMEDVTEKTDYDTIGGTDNVLKYVDARTGETRILMPAKDLKGVQLRWSDDGRSFAYAKKGEVFVQGIDGGQPRSLTPKPKTDPEKDKPAADKPEAEKEKNEELFTPVSFSRDGAKLLVTSRRAGTSSRWPTARAPSWCRWMKTRTRTLGCRPLTGRPTAQPFTPPGPRAIRGSAGSSGLTSRAAR
jgi:dipeptidyl aminopeptidase/acylaminoacyl peptidase